MKITKRQLRKIICEVFELDLEVGDVILTGRFKNKRTTVRDVGVDDLGQPTINGMKALNFRIEKLMPKSKWSKKSLEEESSSNYVLPRSLAIEESPIHGLGIFATRSIPAHTDLGTAQVRVPHGGYQVTDLGKYHNHSEDPTCYNKRVGKKRHLFPHHKLSPGEEITVDYRLQRDLEQPRRGWKKV